MVGTDTPNAIAGYNTFMSNTLRWLDQLRAGDVVRVQFPDVVD